MLYLGLSVQSVPTYQAVCAVVPVVLPTDVLTMFGSATKTVSILNIWINGVQATGAQVQFALIRRSSPNSGGTALAVAPTAQDQSDPAATAAILNYSANPVTSGNSVGNIKADRSFVPNASSATFAEGLHWCFNAGKNIVLRGVNQGIALSLGGVSMVGGTLNVTIEFSEY